MVLADRNPSLRIALVGLLVVSVVAGALVGGPLVLLSVWGLGGLAVAVCGLLLLSLLLYALPSLVQSGLDATPAETAGRADLQATVDRLAQTIHAPAPQVAVVDDPRPNAATVGGGAGTLFVTTGLLDLLGGEELRAVLAHELAQLRHHDATLMTLLALPVVFTMGMHRAASDAREGGHYHGTGIGVIVAIPVALVALLSFPVTVLFSRTREYAADRAAAVITGDPAALGMALQRIDRVRAHNEAADTTDADAPTLVGTLGIVPDEGFPLSHPPVSKRVERLRSLLREQESG